MVPAPNPCSASDSVTLTSPVTADHTLSVLSSEPLTMRFPQNCRQVITWSSWPFSTCGSTGVCGGQCAPPRPPASRNLQQNEQWEGSRSCGEERQMGLQITCTPLMLLQDSRAAVCGVFGSCCTGAEVTEQGVGGSAARDMKLQEKGWWGLCPGAGWTPRGRSRGFWNPAESTVEPCDAAPSLGAGAGCSPAWGLGEGQREGALCRGLGHPSSRPRGPHFCCLHCSEQDLCFP